MNLKKELKKFGKVTENVDVKTLNTFKIGGHAAYLVEPDNSNDIIELLNYLEKNNISYQILGNGSNIILPDEDFDGVLIKLDLIATEIYPAINAAIAESGVMLSKFAHETVENSLTGLEWAVGIPGTVGGSIVCNAGAYKSDIYEHLESVTLITPEREIKVLKKDEIEYGYRHSMFLKKGYIILIAKFHLELGSPSESKELIADRQERRVSSQPLEFPSAGSIFRNPEDAFAGKLIEDCGLKGKKIGGAMVSEKHANFIINVGDATSKDILALIKEVHDTVLEKTGYDLKMEQEIINWK